MKKSISLLYRTICNLINSPAIVLLYHRVTKLAFDPQQLSVDPDNFYEHIQYLKKNFVLLDLAEFVDILLTGASIPKRTVLITFDDGYSDNYNEGLPILENLEAKALFFISTSKLGTNYEFWWDNLERIFLTDQPLPDALHLKEHGISLATTSNQNKLDAYNKLHLNLKNVPALNRDIMLDEIICWSGMMKEGRKSHRLLTIEELVKLSQSRYALIGAHTHNHPKLSVCSTENQKNEIGTSRKILSEICNTEIEFFSYPYGTKDDYTKETVRISKELNFKLSFSNYHSLVHSWHSPYEVPRMLVRNWCIQDFQDKMNTFFKY